MWISDFGMNLCYGIDAYQFQMQDKIQNPKSTFRNRKVLF
ncbi:MAG: hypothetical protein RIS64_3160 [Bacteroidota bacterium]|jgi:hypothetical protein